MLEVIEAAEGDLVARRCPIRGGPCRWVEVCAVHPTWVKASEAIRSVLEQTSLAEVATVDRRLELGEPHQRIDALRLFFIELSTRQVHVAGTASRPDSAWVTQQARNLSITGGLEDKCLLIRDREARFSDPFDEVFGTEGLTVVKTPVRAPKANAIAERWVGSVRRECLDHILIWKASLAARPRRVLRALQPGETAPGPRPSTARSRIGL